MKRQLLFFLFFFSYSYFISVYSFSQTIEWARRAGGNASEYGYAIEKDDSGCLYITGNFSSDPAQFGDSIIIPISPEFGGGYLAKYNSNGNFLWIRQMCSSGGKNSIAIDSTGIYRVGNGGSGTEIFEGGNNSDITLMSSGNTDGYMAKYDTSGNLLWVRQGTGYNAGIFRSVVSNKDGTVSVLGGFGDSITLNGISNTITLDAPGNSPGMLIAKYNSDGEILWAEKAGGNCPYPCGWGGNPNEVNGFAVTSDNNDNIYIAGDFVGTVTFGTGITLTDTIDFKIFLAKYDSQGNFLWVKQLGSDNTNGYQDEEPGDIKTDANGNIYMIGRFNRTTTFETTILTCNQLDFFFAKFDENGNLIWAKQGNNSLVGYGLALNISKQGNLFITGSFKGNMNFGGGPVNLNSSGDFNMFVAKLKTDGNPVWGIATNSQTNSSKCGGYGIISDDNENCFITGFFEGTVSFGDSTYTSGKMNGLYWPDIFIAKLSDATGIANLTGIKKNENNSFFSIFPNPTNNAITVTYKSTGPITNLQLEIKNTAGQTIYSNCYNNCGNEIRDEINLAGQPKGIYFIEILVGGGQTSGGGLSQPGQWREVRKFVLE